MNTDNLLTFGPVPSRRLGHSLGINNIPPKICSYACIYCQVGKTIRMQVERGAFYTPENLFKAVEKRINDIQDRKEHIDYLTFVSDGEPTLDITLGKSIDLLKKLGIKIAVITNASLIWKDYVRADLSKADWVSLKIDTVSETIWHKINRSHKYLQLDKILQGITEFSHIFKGELLTETMIIQGINDDLAEMEKTSNFIAGLKNAKSYIAIPTRPPVEKWVKPANEQFINTAYQLFKEKNINAEYLIGYEGNAFAFTGNIEEDLLSITAVHPMREDAVNALLKKAKTNWIIVDRLIEESKLVELKYKDKKFYMRKSC